MTTPTSVLEDRLRSHYRTVADEVQLAQIAFDDLVATGPLLRLAESPAPARRTWRVATLVVAAAALVAVGLVIATRNSPSSPVAADEPVALGDVPLLVPDWLPSGVKLRGASDTTVPELAQYRTAVYAMSGGVLTGKLLSVTVTTAPFASWRSAGAPTIVAGRDAVDLSSAGVAGLAVDNGESGSITLAGRGFTSSELATVAEGLGSPSTDPTDGPVFDPAPTGLSLVSDEAGPTASRATELSYTVSPATEPSYEAGDLERMVSIGVWSGEANAFEQYLVHAEPGEATEVGGLRAWQSTDSDGIVHLAWELAPGIVAQVSGTGVGDGDVERVAKGLRRVSDVEWRRLLATVGVEPLDGDPTEAPPTTVGATVTAPCTEQQGVPPVTAVVNCGG